VNAVEMNELAQELARKFMCAGGWVPTIREVISHGDPALAVAVRTKIKSETERKRFDALMLLEGVK